MQTVVNLILMQQKEAPPGGLEPPTFRLTAERASRLRHGGRVHDGGEEKNIGCMGQSLVPSETVVPFLSPPLQQSVMV